MYWIAVAAMLCGFVAWAAFVWWAVRGPDEDPNQPEDGTRIELENAWFFLKCPWLLPRAGTVVGRVRSKYGRQWVLLQLDSPAVDPLGVSHTHVLLRSRYGERQVGSSKATEARVLQVEKPAQIQPGFEVWRTDVIAHAWAKRETISA